MSPRIRSVAGWILRILGTLLFLAAGLPKLSGHPAIVAQFNGWGYAAWFAYVVGIAETAGAVGLLIPRTVRPAALLLAVVMLGATATHILNAEWGRLFFVIPLGAVILTIPWLARPTPTESE